MDVPGFGRMLLVAAALLALAGLLMIVAGKIPFLGRLPGDIVIRRGNATFYFPVVTCLVVSILLTAIFRLFGRR